MDYADKALQEWRTKYNCLRPHEALGNKCPADVYTHSERIFADKVEPFEYEPGFKVIKVNSWGYVRFQNFQLYLSETFINDYVQFRPNPNNDSFLVCYRNLLLLSMTRHPASVFTARFQDCEFVYHVLAQVVTMLHLTPCSPIQICTNIAYLHSGIFTLSLTRLSSRKGCGVPPQPIIFNFPFYIFNLKRISRTWQMPYSGEFYLFTYSLCTSFSQNYSASGRLASFSR